MVLERIYAFSGLFLSVGNLILHILFMGGTVAKRRYSSYVGSNSTLKTMQDRHRSIKDPETEIVELKAVNSSTRERGHIEVLKSKEMALVSLLDSRVQRALVSPGFKMSLILKLPLAYFWVGKETWVEQSNPLTVFGYRAGTHRGGPEKGACNGVLFVLCQRVP